MDDENPSSMMLVVLRAKPLQTHRLTDRPQRAAGRPIIRDQISYAIFMVTAHSPHAFSLSLRRLFREEHAISRTHSLDFKFQSLFQGRSHHCRARQCSRLRVVQRLFHSSAQAWLASPIWHSVRTRRRRYICSGSSRTRDHAASQRTIVRDRRVVG